MKRFIFDLSDENRARLEAHRVAWGLRSLSAAVQHLIETKVDAPFSDEERGRIMREIYERTLGQERASDAGGLIPVSTAELKAINKAVRDEPRFQSRLKGVWKAP